MLSLGLVLGVAAGLWLAALACVGVQAVRRERRPESTLARTAAAHAGVPGHPPHVSIVVPARDEGLRVGGCVRSLLALDYPSFELIVVDDGSTDGTAAVACAAGAGDPRLRVLEAGPLPLGWSGKNHALWRGQAAARGSWLLFTDADTRHAPGSLRRALEEASARGAELLSLAGRQKTGSLAERLVQPFLFEFLARRFPLLAVNDPADLRAAANGQYLLVSRRLYHANGGHEAVRGELLEDVALARLAKRRGARIAFLSAPDLLEVRMYEGLRSLAQGWTKNLADLAGGPLAAAAEGGRFLARGVGPLLALAATPLVASSELTDLAVGPMLGAGLGLGALVAEAAVLAPLHGTGRATALLAPVGAAVAGALFLASAWRRTGERQVVWRGRRYPAASAV